MTAIVRFNRYGLTRRELEALSLAAEGKDTKSIARQMVITAHSAKAHIHGAISKLGVSSRIEALLIAHAEGLLDLDDCARRLADRIERYA